MVQGGATQLRCSTESGQTTSTLDRAPHIPSEFTTHVYDLIRRGPRRRACRLSRHQLVGAREGVPPLGPRHHRSRHPVRSGPAVRSGVRQAGRIRWPPHVRHVRPHGWCCHRHAARHHADRYASRRGARSEVRAEGRWRKIRHRRFLPALLRPHLGPRPSLTGHIVRSLGQPSALRSARFALRKSDPLFAQANTSWAGWRAGSGWLGLSIGPTQGGWTLGGLLISMDPSGWWISMRLPVPVRVQPGWWLMW
jgi:hypothetical protein